jgi:hypothetical protein
MSRLLITTTGTTDVQIVKEGKRYALSKQKCNDLLDQIVKREYSFCDELPEKAMKEGKAEEIQSLPEGNLQVCIPKLDAVLRYLESEGSMPDAVLILETGRDLPDDPRQAGAVFQKRLQERGVQQICRETFLRDRERLEDSKDKRDAVVRRDVVRRLDNAIRNAFENEKQRPTEVYTALAGGLPESNDVIQELVRLYAVASSPESDVISLKVPDGSKIRQKDEAIPEPFHPAAGLRARWQALQLIQKGNLLAAWGAVSHLEIKQGEDQQEEVQPGQEWTKVVRWLANFAASLPIDDECDIAVLKHPKMAVRAALRVEFALLAGDIPRAVHGTVAFFESALWDHLNEHISPHPEPKKRLFKFKTKPDAELIRETDQEKLCVLTDAEKRENRKKPFILKDPNFDKTEWYFIDDSEICAVRIAEKYLKLKGLTEFAKKLDTEIRQFRNDVAHNEPTTELMEQAKKRMQCAELWSEGEPPSFLSQPLVIEVLKELGEKNPAELHSKLIEDVRKKILNLND